MQPFTIRTARPEDSVFLLHVLLLAMNWNPERPAADERVVRARPELAHYVEGWPRDGDAGVVAEADGRPIGAAWLRFFGRDEPGYGFVSDDVPEITIGVHAEWRGHGVGARLLDALIGEARRLGLARLSLSVEPENRAIERYRSRGFRPVGRNSDAVTMLLDLTGPAPAAEAGQ